MEIKEIANPISTITGMEFKYYNAAVEGNIGVFKGMDCKQIESLLTPNKNTILHVHLSDYTKSVSHTSDYTKSTKSVSDTFVGKVLDVCLALPLKTNVTKSVSHTSNYTKSTKSVSDTFVGKVLDMCPALLLMTNVKKETLLHIAAIYGHDKIVRKLIDCAKARRKGDDADGDEKKLIRALNDKKDTALHEAARYGRTQVVEVLIKEEPDGSYFGQNDDGETPLYIAVERQYWDVVDAILNKSNSPRYDGPSGRTALHAATIFGDREKVSQLLTVNLSAAKEKDENGWVPLHLAALHGNPKVVEELVCQDSSTAYMRDKKGRTALHLAALRQNVSAMKRILKYCPDCCELVDEEGCNALHYSAMDELHLMDVKREKEIVEIAPLLRKLCNEKDKEGNTPLHYIAHLAPKWKTHYDHVLLQAQILEEVDKMACNKDGQNPLDVAGVDMTRDPACEMMDNKLLRKLQDAGAMLGVRVPYKRPREKKQEKRHDPAVDEKEKENKTNGEDDVFGKATIVFVSAILIATITFAAGFTLPGGLNQDKGSPILRYNAAFIAFVITDSLSFVLSTSAVLLQIYWILAMWGSEGKNTSLRFKAVAKCARLTLLAMGFMIVAFGTGLYAVLGVSKGFGIVTLLIVLSFFIIMRRILRVDRGSMEVVGVDQFIRYDRNCDLQRVKDVQLSYIP